MDPQESPKRGTTWFSPFVREVPHMKTVFERKWLCQVIQGAHRMYFAHGPTSSKKVDHFHEAIKNKLELYFTVQNGYVVELERSIPSCNSTGKKRCDIVILKNNIPYIVFPVKMTMTNYKQNKNNSWETLTGEITHLKWANRNLHIIPINIFMDKTPYLMKEKTIKRFEHVVPSDIENYNLLIANGLCYDVINYIVEVKHIKKENECFDDIHPVTSLVTEYRTFGTILANLM